VSGGLFCFYGEVSIVPYYAYVLQSEEGYHYAGHTANLDLRIIRHGLRTTHYTKKGRNWEVIYSKEFLTRAEAMKHEKWLKSGVGRE
jgi:putative endonuclease